VICEFVSAELVRGASPGFGKQPHTVEQQRSRDRLAVELSTTYAIAVFSDRITILLLRYMAIHPNYESGFLRGCCPCPEYTGFEMWAIRYMVKIYTAGRGEISQCIPGYVTTKESWEA
jgi:hypothetical protein